ncbi:nucleoside/nucleotide kinase family protein [Arthrobacter mobilis]|uniref:Nucleoside/nucleotide kinase family protein n=1 Tax=Arthrobacter mobilis TaxID=2724944 RepID=A0A7X6HDX0_9MICC|nr:nucleoside/nucleotide kinase family protein [Arthrobacter mobilis]NKX53852.1 nucleoside/nucleotide kinase family protein [Arthrobacter mobilis]
MTIQNLLERVTSLAASPGGRTVIGVTGAPGAGKTTLVEALIRELNADTPVPEHQRYAHVPMDGFHLSDAELTRLALLGRKGAPETFDVYGYAAMLARLRTDREHVVYAPGFERRLEQPIAGVVPVFPGVETVLTEGNYLLLDQPGWHLVQEQCTEIWYCDQDDAVRIQRLTERHVRFGKTPAAAAAWVRDVDERNAGLIRATKDRADLIIYC